MTADADQLFEAMREKIRAEDAAYRARVEPAWHRLRELGGSGRVRHLLITTMNRPGHFFTGMADPSDPLTSPEADAAAAELDSVSRMPTPARTAARDLYDRLRSLLWP